MGNVIFKSPTQTKGSSGISGSSCRNEKKRSGRQSKKPVADKQIKHRPLTETDSRSKKEYRLGASKNKSRTGTDKRPTQAHVSKSSKTELSAISSRKNSDRESKDDAIADPRRNGSRIPGKVSQPSNATQSDLPTENPKKDESDIIEHTNDVIEMVDEWKKEEQRLQKEYEDAKHRIRASLRQENQAKAEAQTWRMELEKLAHFHRERLFEQATILRGRLRSAEEHLASSERKVKGLSLTNDKLKGIIEKANQKARSVRLQSEKQREVAKRELKAKLHSVEAELQNLTEKISSSGIIEDMSSKRSLCSDDYGSSRPTNKLKGKRTHRPARSIGLYGANWKIPTGVPAKATPTGIPMYELSTLQPQYIDAPIIRQIPQFSYHSYPVPILPQSKTNWPRVQHDPVLQTESCFPRQYTVAPIFGGISSPGPTFVTNPSLTLKNRGATKLGRSLGHLPGSKSNQVTSDDAKTSPAPPSYHSVTTYDGATFGHDTRIEADNEPIRELNFDLASADRAIGSNTVNTSRTELTPCEKCHSLNRQQLLVQQREVYNAFARSRDRRTSRSPTIPLFYDADVEASNTASPYSVMAYNEAPTGGTVVGTCGCSAGRGPLQSINSSLHQRPKPFSCSAPSAAATTEFQPTLHQDSAAAPAYCRGYHDDLDPSDLSLAVMKKRRIVHRQVTMENRTR